jgi:hypothetical protein
MLSKLWKKTKEVATMYTGTFVVVMFLNQLLFFGLCLNPVCLVAAMPHVLFITVVVGTWLNKSNILNDDDETSGEATESPSCPKCGSSMRLRTARRGPYAGQEFWGCKNYPSCNGIVNL